MFAMRSLKGLTILWLACFLWETSGDNYSKIEEDESDLENSIDEDVYDENFQWKFAIENFNATENFKFMVLIRAKNENFSQNEFELDFNYICNGAIIDKNHILTSASCMDQIMTISNLSTLTVISGTNRFDESGQWHELENVTLHPESLVTENYDIAVITLKQPIVFDYNHQKINLPEKDFVEGSTALSAYWIDAPEVDMKMNIILKENNVTVHRCQKSDNRNICSTFVSEEDNACLTGGGGPLVLNGTIIGVFSWDSEDCGLPGSISHYTNVYDHLNFIHNVINKS